MSVNTINKSMTVADAVKGKSRANGCVAKDGIDFAVVGPPLVRGYQAKGKNVDEHRFMLNTVQHAQSPLAQRCLAIPREQLIDYIIHNYHREQLDTIDEIDQGLAKLLNVHYDHHGAELDRNLSNFPSN